MHACMAPISPLVQPIAPSTLKISPPSDTRQPAQNRSPCTGRAIVKYPAARLLHTLVCGISHLRRRAALLASFSPAAILPPLALSPTCLFPEPADADAAAAAAAADSPHSLCPCRRGALHTTRAPTGSTISWHLLASSASRFNRRTSHCQHPSPPASWPSGSSSGQSTGMCGGASCSSARAAFCYTGSIPSVSVALVHVCVCVRARVCR